MRFGQYDHLNEDDPLFGELLPLETVCKVAAQKNFGALRLVTELVRQIEADDECLSFADGYKRKSPLAAAIREAIEAVAF